MSANVRSSPFDVLILQSPRVREWPSPSVNAFSTICADYGLKVGAFGGAFVRVRGVIPREPTGGLAIVEDAQGRIHRLDARAIVRVSPGDEFCDPFPGSVSPGLLPLSTSLALWKLSKNSWRKGQAILGSGNRALRFGSNLLEKGYGPVYCVETSAGFEKKRLAAWEVERRRFEILGGKFVFGKLLKLTQKAPMAYELRIGDEHGVRVIEISRVTTAGPFGRPPVIREYPPGSLLLEYEQVSSLDVHEDVEAWNAEITEAELLASRLVRALIPDLGARKPEMESLQRRSRHQLRNLDRHQREPWVFQYQGKWLHVDSNRAMKAFSGVPKHEHLKKLVASIECFEDISCNLCQRACPETAIQIVRSPSVGQSPSFLIEDRCTGCGLCLPACPSSVPVLIREREDQSVSQITLPIRQDLKFKLNENVQLLNRRGEALGLGRATQILEFAGVPCAQVELPTHLLWEARGVAKAPSTSLIQEIEAGELVTDQIVEIQLNGRTRRVSEGISIGMALHEFGVARVEDGLLCPDGSCQLCAIDVDGVKKLACQTKVRKGMSILSTKWKGLSPISPEEEVLCPCLGITTREVAERVAQGRWQTPESAKRSCGVAEGRCHGARCLSSFKRVLEDRGIASNEWINWDFPWSDWVFSPPSG